MATAGYTEQSIGEPDEGESAESALGDKLRLYREYSEAWSPQGLREQSALRFQVPEFQWDDKAKAERAGSGGDGVPSPARPILSVSRLSQPIRSILNQERNSKLGIGIHPLSPEADDDVAEVEQGLYRSIERESQASHARSWAFARAVMAGRGFYRVGTAWDEASDNPMDQKITIERILYQAGVYWDPSATKPDFSDAEGCFLSAYMPLKRFRATYPDAKIPDPSDGSLGDAIGGSPDWITGEGENRAVLVAEYFYKVRSQERLALMQDGSVLSGDDVPEKGDKAIIRERKREVVSVHRCVFTSAEVIEESDWGGKYIPIITAIGDELQPFDEKRRWMGIIEPNMDGQKLYNFALSTAVEKASLEPKAPFMVTPEQIEGLEKFWQNVNRANMPYIMYNAAKDASGNALPPPGRVQVDGAGTSLALMLLQQADAALQAGTFEYDPSLGRTNNKERSGKAIQELKQQSDLANSNYLYTMADVTMAYEARVVLDLMRTRYDRPGRIVRTLDDEDGSETVMLNQPFVIDPDTKRPVAVVETAQGYMVQETGQSVPPDKVKMYDLSRAEYDVSVSVGKSYQSQVAQGADEIGQILQARPELLPLLGPLYFKYRQFPGADAIGDILKKVRDRDMPFLAESEDGEPTPEQLAAENQALKTQVQEMGGALQEAQAKVATDQAKQQASLQKAQMETQAKVTIAAQSDAKDLQIAQLQAQVDMIIKKLELGQRTASESAKIVHEGEQERFSAAHESALQAQKAKDDRLFPEYAGSADMDLGKEDEV